MMHNNHELNEDIAYKDQNILEKEKAFQTPTFVSNQKCHFLEFRKKIDHMKNPEMRENWRFCQ